MHLLLLTIGLTLFPAGYALTCNQCDDTDGPTGACWNTTIQTCPNKVNQRCAAMALSTTNVFESSLIMKTCVDMSACANGSVNLGVVDWDQKIKCCATNNCNNDPPIITSLPKENGKKCYTCNNSRSCEETPLSCRGEENSCITLVFTIRYIITDTYTYKGCASEKGCEATVLTATLKTAGLPWQNYTAFCCQGHLCNGAEFAASNHTTPAGGGATPAGNGTTPGATPAGNGTTPAGNGTTPAGNGTTPGTTPAGNGTTPGGNGTTPAGNGAKSATGSLFMLLAPVLLAVLCSWR